MNSLRSFLSALRHRRAQHASKWVCGVSERARYRFRHSMLGEPGIDEAVRLFGVGR
jgi:hypothetical protein